MAAVSIDDAWNTSATPSSVVEPSEAPPAQKLGSPGTIAVDPRAILHIIDELQHLRMEQTRNAQSLWVTLAAGLVLVLISLSSISRSLHALDASTQRLTWGRGGH